MDTKLMFTVYCYNTFLATASLTAYHSQNFVYAHPPVVYCNLHVQQALAKYKMHQELELKLQLQCLCVWLYRCSAQHAEGVEVRNCYDYPQKQDDNRHSGILLSSHKKVHSTIFTDKDRSKKRRLGTTPYLICAEQNITDVDPMPKESSQKAANDRTSVQRPQGGACDDSIHGALLQRLCTPFNNLWISQVGESLK